MITSAISSDSQRGPLLLLLHGYGSHERDLPPIAQELGCDFLAVRAPLDLGGGGYAWMPLRLDGEVIRPPDPSEVAQVSEGLLTWLDAELDPARTVIPVGFSQGGFMATQLLRHRPERFAAAGVLSGFAAGHPQPEDETLRALQPPVFFGHGDADQVIRSDRFAASAQVLEPLVELEHHVYPGMGHAVWPQELEDLRAFLARVAAS